MWSTSSVDVIKSALCPDHVFSVNILNHIFCLPLSLLQTTFLTVFLTSENIFSGNLYHSFTFLSGTVRIWHANTYRLETTLNYGLERVWAVASQKGSNNVAFGYDEGSILIKVHCHLFIYKFCLKTAFQNFYSLKDKESRITFLQSLESCHCPMYWCYCSWKVLARPSISPVIKIP